MFCYNSTQSSHNKTKRKQIRNFRKNEKRKVWIQFCDYTKETQFPLALEWLKLKSWSIIIKKSLHLEIISFMGNMVQWFTFANIKYIPIPDCTKIGIFFFFVQPHIRTERHVDITLSNLADLHNTVSFFFCYLLLKLKKLLTKLVYYSWVPNKRVYPLI